MRYNSAKGGIFLAAIVLVAGLGVFSLVAKVYVAFIIIGLTLALFTWMLFDTYYIINDGKLFYKCAFIKGSVSVDAIYEIEQNKTMYSGLKPALARKGLIVKYNKYDDIYLSPQDSNKFIAHLKGINPHINIIPL